MDWGLAATFLAASVAAGATGMIFKPGDWYEGLVKPDWRPKNWMFPVAWTLIYVLSALAAARVAGLAGNGQAMAFWAMQIALNTLWTPVFFGARRMGFSVVVMGALVFAVRCWSRSGSWTAGRADGGAISGVAVLPRR